MASLSSESHHVDRLVKLAIDFDGGIFINRYQEGHWVFRAHRRANLRNDPQVAIDAAGNSSARRLELIRERQVIDDYQARFSLSVIQCGFDK
jgi:hypothetical protein